MNLFQVGDGHGISSGYLVEADDGIAHKLIRFDHIVIFDRQQNQAIRSCLQFRRHFTIKGFMQITPLITLLFWKFFFHWIAAEQFYIFAFVSEMIGPRVRP